MEDRIPTAVVVVDAVEVPAAEPSAPAEPQFVRAPVGNGHEAALKQGGTR